MLFLIKLSFFLLFSLACTLSFAQVHKAPKSFAGAIPYDTIYLQNNCRLIFAMNNEYRFIRLLGPAVDTVIHSINSKAPEPYLGKFEADFGDCFALYWDQSFPYVRVFNKADGRLFVQGVSIEIDTIHHRIFYVDIDHQREFGIFDAITKKIELFPAIATPCLWWFECIVSQELTEKELTLTYMDKNNRKLRKVYPR